MSTIATVGVVREGATGECRVALVPAVLGKVTALGLDVLVESGAGDKASYGDQAYESAGASIASAEDLYRRADIVLGIGPPTPRTSDLLRPGQLLVGVLQPWERPAEVARWAQRGVTAISLDLLPRTLSRAQTMDVLTSQASVAGYKAAIRAADTYGGYFPMLMTAAGTVKPARVLVLGAGVAGLQAIATARRLGASVSAYDVRPQSRDEVASLGARFVDLPGVASAAGSGGYARELTADEQQAQRDALDGHIAASDVVITTAQVPGRKPPLLVTAAAVSAMRPGAVIVDGAAGPHGGNVAVSQQDRVTVVDPGVTVIGAGNLPSEMPAAASTAYARNMLSLLGYLVTDGVPVIDLSDDVQTAIVITHDGAVRYPKDPVGQ